MIKDVYNVFVQKSDFFIKLLVEHLEISLISILIAIIFGVIYGIFISEYKKISKPSLGLISFLYTIPSISMFGLLIPFTGIGNITAIMALSIYALLPIVRNTYTGITNIDDLIIEAAKGMGSTNFQILYKIKLPLALPFIFSGIRSMVTMTIALTGIASFIGAGGLGVAIYRGITINQSSLTIAGSLLIALTALVIDLILGFLEKRINMRSVKAKKTNKIIFISLLLLIIVFLFSPYINIKNNKEINVATKPMSEEYILGEMLKFIIEDKTDLKVNITHGVGGGTSNIMPAMLKGDFDIYPEYTGTGWSFVLKNKRVYNEEMFSLMQSQYDKMDMKWVGIYGFNNTFGIALREDIAKKYNIESYSDLSKLSSKLTFGGEYDFFEREDGYKALNKKYGLNFKKTIDIDVSLKYKAIENKRVDAIVIFTTDGRLESSNLRVLKDDLNFFPSYKAGNIVRKEILKKYPKLEEVLNLLSNTIDDKEMSKMNYKVEILAIEPKQVAKEFLLSKNLIKEEK